MADKESKRQIPLRVSASLYEALAAWAEDDFRSLNGQIEYLLTECVRRRRGMKIAKSAEENAREGLSSESPSPRPLFKDL